MWKINLHPYQEYAKQFVITHPYCGLFLDMGLGKTLITLAALYDLNPPHHCLIIAPKGVAISTWQDEIEKFNIPLRIRSLVLNEQGKKYTRKKRMELYDQIVTLPPSIWVINRDIVAALVEEMLARRVWPFGTVVIDESQSFKSPTSQRFKTLAKVRPYIYRLILLSGTPAPNGPEDLWSQMYLLDMGQRLGNTMKKYYNNFFEPAVVKKGKVLAYRPFYGAENMIYQRIADLCISMKNTMLQLPAITFNDFYVHMDEKEKELYRKMMETYVLQLGTDVIRAVNPAVLSAKLSQMASGAIYTNENHDYAVIHKHKLEAVEYIVNNTDSPVLVAYHYKTDCDQMMEYLPSVGINAQVFDGSSEMKQAWNNREIPVMLLQPASYGAGLNLQDGGHTLIWYTIPWSLEQYLQTNTRIYRQGQNQPVVVHHLLTKDTIDAKILAAIQQKDMSEKALLEAVKVTIEQAYNL